MTENELNVSGLPTYVFGARSISWWATVGMTVIEAFMYCLCLGTYFYLATVSPKWPPPTMPLPGLFYPNLMGIALIISLLVAIWLDIKSRKEQKNLVLAGLIILSLLGIAIIILRWFELWALGTKWDVNAYGSVIWIILGVHTFHTVFEVLETIVMTLVFASGHTNGQILVNISDSCIFWYFIIAAWILTYPIVYLGPYYL
jgi:cytochrome c oxidase subunit 3